MVDREGMALLYRGPHPTVERASGRGRLAGSPTSLPALVGQAGSIRLTHDGRYGDLTGKAVALEPATAFTFDTPLVPRPR